MAATRSRGGYGKGVPLHDLRKWFQRPHGETPRRTILVVDDPEERRRTVRSVERLGYSALQAADAESALDVLAAEDPACVLLSLDVAGGKGLEVLSQLRANEPDVCVVMLARSWRDSRTVQAMRLGAVAYLAKPFGQDDLREVLTGR